MQRDQKRGTTDSTNHGGPTTRLHPGGVATVSRPATVIKQLIEHDPSTATERALTRLSAPSTIVRCCRPNCSLEFNWPGRGRAPRFCSERCRLQFAKERARLISDLKAYEALRDECSSTWVQSVEIDSRISILKMHLLRYRPFEVSA